CLVTHFGSTGKHARGHGVVVRGAHREIDMTEGQVLGARQREVHTPGTGIDTVREEVDSRSTGREHRGVDGKSTRGYRGRYVRGAREGHTVALAVDVTAGDDAIRDQDLVGVDGRGESVQRP